MSKTFSIAVFACALSIGSASAADLHTKAPAAPAYSWTGFYVGGNVGYGWEDPTVTFKPNDLYSADVLNGMQSNRAPLSPPTAFNTSGVAGGVQVGYNHQFNSLWVGGIEADFSGSGIKGQGSQPFTGFPGDFDQPYSTKINENVDWFGTVRGRLGYLVRPDLLVFGTGGFAYGEVKRVASITNFGTENGVGDPGRFTVICSADVPACYTGSSSKVGTGYAVGGGIEYALLRNWTVKAEYLYVNLGSDAVLASPVRVCCGPGQSSITASFTDTHFNLVRVGANYRF